MHFNYFGFFASTLLLLAPVKSAAENVTDAERERNAETSQATVMIDLATSTESDDTSLPNGAQNRDLVFILNQFEGTQNFSNSSIQLRCCTHEINNTTFRNLGSHYYLDGQPVHENETFFFEHESPALTCIQWNATFKKSDDGRKLSCAATPAMAERDYYNVSVLYGPDAQSVHVDWTSTIGPDLIISANPKPRARAWIQETGAPLESIITTASAYERNLWNVTLQINESAALDFYNNKLTVSLNVLNPYGQITITIKYSKVESSNETEMGIPIPARETKDISWTTTCIISGGVLVATLLIIIVVYARWSGMWCFRNRRFGYGVEEQTRSWLATKL